MTEDQKKILAAHRLADAAAVEELKQRHWDEYRKLLTQKVAERENR